MPSEVVAAAALMHRFAERTGVGSEGPQRRYLWTDAFAVCNFLGLARATGEPRYLDLALRLVEQVHRTLGSHRADDARRGWIGGLTAEEGARHPTRGGLRIGKKLPERAPSEPSDDALEWDRDGQYFHYLTKWMHALDQATRATGSAVFNTWARELAAAADDAFVYTTASGARRMYWKMSIDLRRPLVPSMGQHDPLDGFVTLAQLEATAAQLPQPTAGPSLRAAAGTLASMIDTRGLATADSLGLGGLLVDAYRVDQLERGGALETGGLRDLLLASALAGLEPYLRTGELERAAERRLAFRELGLAIGLRAVAHMRDAGSADPTGDAIDAELIESLAAHAPVADRIIAFWLGAAHATARTWTEHLDINEVMLATALAPEGFLVLRPVDANGGS
ncbi:MAG: hypothetical protein E6J72_07655 [Deltaproteobacteria bacterium]|nr:MAG: hypothetical protein E6J72_07655 [Deltaproteobacteria bacterium]